MSEYFKSLPPVAKERYLSKLRCLNLKEEDNPYLSSKFVEDLCLRPSVEYGHIFTSFNDLEYIHSNSCYSGRVWMPTITLEVAMFVQWRYGLHLTSFVFWKPRWTLARILLITPTSLGFLYMMYGRVGLINIMILLFSTKFIFNCISRLGEGCSHVATVLFKIVAAVRNG